MSKEIDLKKIRIAINGVGNVGQRLIRFCDMKGLNIVAAYNRSGDKIGQDIGRLAGLEKDLGVVVEDGDTADYSQLKADIVLNATTDLLHLNYPIYERFLSAGINVLCHACQGYNPFFENREIAEKIDQLAKKNGVTFTATGIWDTTRLWSGIIAAGTCLKINSVVHTSQAEIGRPGAQFVQQIGVGLTIQEFEDKFSNETHSLSIYLHGPCVIVLQKLGCTIKDVKKYAEPVIFNENVYCPYTKKEYAAGLVVGARIISEITTEEGIIGRSETEYRLFKDGEVEETGWKINGMPGLAIRVIRDDTANLSAASLFNRIPDVLAAEPGIVEIMKMGPLNSSALL